MDTTEIIDPVTGEIIDEQQLAEQLLKQAKEQRVDLLGPDGLLNGLTKRVLETALDAEMTEHLGRDKHQPADGGNIRNGTRSKTVLTEVGPVQIDVPRDRDGSLRDILGIWAGDGGEGAKFWLGVMTEIKNRGAEDVCVVVCDGLKGLPESINTAWPLATVQTCIIHLIRNTFRFASRHYWEEMGPPPRLHRPDRSGRGGTVPRVRREVGVPTQAVTDTGEDDTVLGRDVDDIRRHHARKAPP
ncbi:hypothetical protein GCM10025774_15810 [Microbacterium kyungheense]|uniref:Mutator family transposase n=1 Tax=Microbacterium kyungheense TaxID=1263636 RepID=A0A543F275_9MICO|nr:mutator family transposase [Microbacterium kyungheense]